MIAVAFRLEAIAEDDRASFLGISLVVEAGFIRGERKVRRICVRLDIASLSSESIFSSTLMSERDEISLLLQASL